MDMLVENIYNFLIQIPWLFVFPAALIFCFSLLNPTIKLCRLKTN